MSGSSVASSNRPLSRETVVTAFQLEAFIKSGHKYAKLVDEPTLYVIDFLVKNNFRPAEPSRALSTRDQRSRARSVEAPLCPSDWALDKSLFRSALVKFQKDSEPCRRYLHDPPSTGNTPTRSPSTNPAGAESNTPPTSPPIPPTITDTDSTSSNAGNTTRATSAEEAIFNQPIGPPNCQHSMPPSNEPNDEGNWQGTGFTRQQWTALQGLMQAGAQAPPGPPGPPRPQGPPGADGANGNGNSAVR
jgi:hypothetical protein